MCRGYMIFIAKVPKDFKGVASLSLSLPEAATANNNKKRNLQDNSHPGDNLILMKEHSAGGGQARQVTLNIGGLRL